MSLSDPFYSLLLLKVQGMEKFEGKNIHKVRFGIYSFTYRYCQGILNVHLGRVEQKEHGIRRPKV